MQFSFFQVLAIFLTYLLFGFLGYWISRKIKRPVSMAIWFVIVIATLAAPFIRPEVILLGIDEFRVFLNFTLQAIGLGMILGLATREIRIKFKDK